MILHRYFEDQDQTVNVILLEFFDLCPDIFGAIPVIFIIKIYVELGQLDVAHFPIVAIPWTDHSGFGKSRLKFHDIPHDGDDLVGAVQLSDCQAHLCSLGPPNEFDHFPKLHPYDIYRLFLTLSHLDNLVSRL